MIRISLDPPELPAGRPVDVTVLIHNSGDLPCTNLVAELVLPESLRQQTGPRKIEVGRLDPGRCDDHHVIRLRALQAGACSIGIRNFSYREGGRPRRIKGHTIDVDVKALAEVPPDEPGAQPAPTLFVSYRHPEGHLVASLLVKQLPADRVFFAPRSMPLGHAFDEELQRRLQSCAVLVAVIDAGWLEELRARERAGEPYWVRHEIATVLRRRVPVVPLLYGASMPKPHELPDDLRDLAVRHGATVSVERFDDDIAGIARKLLSLL